MKLEGTEIEMIKYSYYVLPLVINLYLHIVAANTWNF